MDYIDLGYLFKHAANRGVSRINNGSGGDLRYYFMHIPKTSGTSFRYALYDQFDSSRVYPNAYHFYWQQKAKYLGWQDYLQRFPSTRCDFEVLMGHFGLQPLSFYKPQQFAVLSFFRDPIRRVKSAIRYHRQTGRAYSNLNLDEILNEHLAKEGSLQARTLGYRKKLNNLSQICESLSKLDFIGITEEFDKSIELCNRTFDWQLSPKIERNVMKDRAIDYSASQLRRIAEACEIDQAIYDAACNIFRNRYRSIIVKE